MVRFRKVRYKKFLDVGKNGTVLRSKGSYEITLTPFLRLQHLDLGIRSLTFSNFLQEVKGS